jgi:colanic acid/amylovoran biosynthesis glycosyltransferase
MTRDQPPDANPLPTIAHSMPSWLPVTQTWLYGQVRCCPELPQIVLTLGLENLESYPWDPVYSGATTADTRVRHTLERLGVRVYPPNWRHAVSTWRPSILHSHFGNRGWCDLPFARRHGLRHIVSFYGYDVALPQMRSKWRRRFRELFAAADLFLCEGPFMAGRLVDQGCPLDKVVIRRLGIDTGAIPYAPRRLDSDGVTRILIAGSFREKKGIPLALEAVGRASARGFPLAVTLIGDSSGTPEEEREKVRILEAIDRTGIHGIVRRLGYQPYERLLAEVYEHHLLLSPSMTAHNGDSEGGAPVTLTEAAASGMPIVSTRHCDIPQVVVDRVTGALVDEGDVAGLTEALEGLARRPEAWPGMSAAARAHVETLFGLPQMETCLRDVYRRLSA